MGEKLNEVRLARLDLFCCVSIAGWAEMSCSWQGLLTYQPYLPFEMESLA